MKDIDIPCRSCLGSGRQWLPTVYQTTIEAVAYEDQVNAKSALYISRSLRAVGWKGASLQTLKADIDAWIKETGGKSTVEIRHAKAIGMLHVKARKAS